MRYSLKNNNLRKKLSLVTALALISVSTGCGTTKEYWREDPTERNERWLNEYEKRKELGITHEYEAEFSIPLLR